MSFRTFLVAAFLIAFLGVPTPPAFAADEDPVVNGKKLSEWVAQLKTPKMNEIITIAEAIGKAGPKAASAVPALLEVMKKGGMYAYYTSEALEAIGPAAVPALIEAAKDKNEVVSATSSSLLRRKFPEVAKKAGLGSIAEELAQMKKLKPEKELKGTSWFGTGALAAGRAAGGPDPEGSRSKTITFAEGTAEWNRLLFVTQGEGKGKYNLDTTKVPARIELSVDETTYKGICAVTKRKDGLVVLTLQLSGPGGDYPKGFFKDGEFPEKSKDTQLHFIRVK